MMAAAGKLTQDDVALIHRLYDEGVGPKSIAAALMVSRAAVQYHLYGRADLVAAREMRNVTQPKTQGAPGTCPLCTARWVDGTERPLMPCGVAACPYPGSEASLEASAPRGGCSLAGVVKVGADA